MTAEPVVYKVVFGNTSLSLFFVALGYAVLGPRVFSKRNDGFFPFWSYLLHWPYFFINCLTFKIWQIAITEPYYTQLSENLFIGRRLTLGDRPKTAEIGIANVLDLTCEFPEVSFLKKVPNYLCIPLMDTQAPTLSQLQEGVEWIRKSVLSGLTFVHCAFGHGRSALFVVAYLLSRNSDLTVGEAINQLKEKHPRIRLTKKQIEKLHQFKTSLNAI
ncbi:MAG: dual specificity protein phosphatase family protein [Pseudomonadota bacterium]